jgi:hypothetical protein
MPGEAGVVPPRVAMQGPTRPARGLGADVRPRGMRQEPGAAHARGPRQFGCSLRPWLLPDLVARSLVVGRVLQHLQHAS